MNDKSKYQSPFSVGKRQTVFIDPNDPRVRGWKAGITASRLGAELEIINSEGVSVAGVFNYLKDASSSSSASQGFDPKQQNIAAEISDILNLDAIWNGENLEITFDFDFDDQRNKYVAGFQYKLYVAGGSESTQSLRSIVLNKTSLEQKIIFTLEDNAYYLGFFRPEFSLLEVQAFDSFENLGNLATLDDIPVYLPDLCTPQITVTSIPMGYSVSTIETCAKPYQFLSIEEVVSDAGTAPTSGYQQVYLSSIKPASIVTPTTEARWVKARYSSNTGLYGAYSNIVKVTPTNPISVDLIPPSEVTSVSGSWSGDNIVINYTLPATDAGVRFQIALTAPNSSVGYFYVFPSGASLNQTATITKADLFTQFGAYYSSFTGVLRSADASDNKSPGISFSIASRTNPLNGITPTFTLTPLVNGYSVSFNKPAGASYAEIYQKYTEWVPSSYQIDSFTATYSSGGASGTNTVTLSNIVDNEGNTVTTIPTGYRIIGTGIASNTYIASVSGNEITVNNNFEDQVSGTLTAYAVVYSGESPANISSTIYEDTYIIIRYYDDFGNASNYSAEQDVIPFSPTTVDITGPGNVPSLGLLTTSGIDESGTLGFNGYIDLSWEAVTESTIRGYRIRFTTDDTDPVYSHVDYPIDQTNIPSGTLSYRLNGLAVGATYYIGIATYDQFNNTSTEYTEFNPETISGTPAITDYITAGNFQFGQGVDPTETTGISGTKRGLFFDSSNYWFLNSSNNARLKVGGSTDNYLLWDGTKFTVDGDINARGGSFSGNIALTTSGASIYSGDVTTNPGNLTGDGFIFNKDGLLIRKGSSQVSLDTANGAITANNGNIADWVISASKIERLDPITSKYAGLSSTGTYKFWSGSTSAGGDITQFAVDNAGKLYASSVQISGGTLDIGAPSTNLSSGFHVLSSGTLYATGAVLNGSITATSGSITGNFQVVSGSFYTGTSPTSTSVIINDKGLASIGSNNQTLTAILNTPIQSGNVPIGDQPSVGTLPSSISFFTKAALIGGWVVGSETITDRSQQFILNSTTNKLSIFGTESGTNYGIILSTGTNFLEAGTRNLNNEIPTPTVSITRTGVLNATGAIINGNITATTMTSTGNFSFAGGILQGTSSSLSLNGGLINIEAIGDVEDDENNFAGDPTLTLNSSNNMVKGRRFIFNGTNNVPINPSTNSGFYTWNNITRTGTFRTNGNQTISVKTGDIIMIY